MEQRSPNHSARDPRSTSYWQNPWAVDRRVKAMLDKLTTQNFNTTSDHLIAFVNSSKHEKDGFTLIFIIRCVYEKAIDNSERSELFARLCRKMMERISPGVQDKGITNAEGKPIAGGQLFRKYLLNRCQEDFERGWVEESPSNKELAGDQSKGIAEKASRRQGLGLIKFIGELFKLQMLTERIMHECIKKLLANVEPPDEQEVQSLCTLLTTVGAQLDTPKAHAHMDIYFSRMKELVKNPNLSARVQFMLQDVLELRERRWVPRNAPPAPTTIAQP